MNLSVPPTPANGDIGEALRDLRERRGLSREELSMRTKGQVHRNTILLAESGKGARIETIRLLALALRVPLSEVIQSAEKIAAQNSVQLRKLA